MNNFEFIKYIEAHAAVETNGQAPVNMGICDFCRIVLQDPLELLLHVLDNHVKVPNRHETPPILIEDSSARALCLNCGLSIPEQKFELHKTEHCENKAEADAINDDLGILLDHFREYADLQSCEFLFCLCCKGEFSDVLEFLEHQNIHKTEFPCFFCKAPTAIKDYKEHLLNACPSNREEYCLYCAFVGDQQALDEHYELSAECEWARKSTRVIKQEAEEVVEVKVLESVDAVFRKRVLCRRCGLSVEADVLEEHWNHRCHRRGDLTTRYQGERMCEYCCERFESLAALDEHLTSHGDKVPCLDCGKKGVPVSQFKLHLIECPRRNAEKWKEAEDTVEFKHSLSCLYCDEAFWWSQDYLSHVKSHNSYVECYLCAQQILRDKYKIHLLKQCSPNKEIICPNCNFAAIQTEISDHYVAQPECQDKANQLAELEAQTELIENRRTRRPMKPRPTVRCICNLCEELFPSRQSLRDHLSTFPAHDVCFYCKELVPLGFKRKHLISCSKVNPRENPLKRRNPPTAGRKVICDLCGQSLHKSALKQHIISKHEQSAPYPCTHCGKHFKMASTLRDHIRAKHTQIRPFRCPFEGCSAAYPSRSSLEVHTFKHTQVSNFFCQLCQKYFQNGSILSAHCQRQHPHIDKDAKCLVCRGDVVEGDAADTHVECAKEVVLWQVAKPSTSVVCSICNKVFATNGTMRKHFEAIHEKKKPFSCHICEWPFAYKSNLRTHLKIHAAKKELDGEQPEMMEIEMIEEENNE